MSDFQLKFAELYQFFGGYFYQGWASDYKWEGVAPSFFAVVRHFKAVNPPPTITRVKNELEDLLDLDLNEAALSEALSHLGSSYYPPSENLTNRQWLEGILEILRESQTRARVLRELN